MAKNAQISAKNGEKKWKKCPNFAIQQRERIINVEFQKEKFENFPFKHKQRTIVKE